APGARTRAVVYRFAIEPGVCNDDSRSLFRLAYPNLAFISACSARGRAYVLQPQSDVSLSEWGQAPRYPAIAESARVQGVVAVELTIAPGGAVTDARAVDDNDLLAPTAVAYAKTLKFRPTDRRKLIVVYEFSLDRLACDRVDEVGVSWVT